MRIFLPLLLIFLLSACAEPRETDRLTLAPVSFSDLQGWRQDGPLPALQAFQKSCKALLAKQPSASMGIGGKADDWRKPCAEATNTLPTNAAARAFFEYWFCPYATSGREGDTGLFTGYYMPEVRGSIMRDAAFQTPLYKRPKDRIEANLALFKPDLNGKIIGKVQGNALVPYDVRAEIAQGSLHGRAEPLVWIDDPTSAFFLEIQGSGFVRLKDGKRFAVGYDSANGRDYTAIGRVLADRGEIQRPVTMPSIRAWLAANPTRAQEVMNENASYVFFRLLPNDEAVGAQGVALTLMRSLAVDPKFLPLGAPVWLDTTDGQGASLQRLMIAQDTGGAIKGPVRGDVFWGEGDVAALQAGAMQSKGRAFVLLPKTVLPHADR